MILTLFLLITTTLQNCSNGCLKCSPQNTCLLCDRLSNYHLVSYACQKSQIEFCMLVDDNGECLFCQAGHYIDPNTLKCIVVDEFTLVDNCSHYSMLGSCIKCDHGFYLEKGLCKLPERQIENCYRYQSSTSCTECIGGYYLDTDHQHCLVNHNEHCSIGSYHVCQECASGYVVNESKIIMDQFNDLPLFDKKNINWNLLEISTQSFLQTNLIGQCDTNVNTNCKVQQDPLHCKVCNEGYYLENLKCKKNPSPKILNCQQYKNRTECQACKDMYYMQQPNQCIDINPIKNCDKYETNLQTKTTCKQCQQGYYLTDNSCMDNDVITNCEIYSTHSNTCQLCKQFYTVNVTKKKCVQKISNCEQHDFDEQGHLTCSKCFDKKYYNTQTKICEEGSIQNCILYSTKSQCQQCKDGYYLNNNQCFAQLSILNCQEHDPVQYNSCLKCNGQSAKVHHNIGCEKILEPIEFCQEYLSQVACKKCIQGYYLTQQKQCDVIPLILNCLEYDANDDCSQCKDNHILDNGKCFAPSKLQTQNCIVSELTGNENFQQAKCMVCNQYSFPFNIKNYMFCMEKQRIEVMDELDIDYCLKHSLNSSNEMICLECQKNYVIKDDECIPQDDCSDTIVPYTIQDDMVSQQNVCINIQTGCLKAVVNQKISNQFICVKCNDDTHVSVLQQWQTLQYDYVPFKNFELFKDLLSKSPVSQHPRITCSLKSNTFVGNALVQNCEYYTLLQSSQLGCVKCINGYTGSIDQVNVITQCSSMVTCQQGEIEGIPQHVNKLMSCHKCQDLNKIPFIFIKGSQPYEYPKSLSGYDSSTLQGSTGGGLSVRCMEINALDLKMNLGFNFVLNCAMGYYNIDSSKNASHSDQVMNIDRNKIGTFCVACKPSFKAIQGTDTQGTVVQDYVGECRQIVNCYYSDWINYCSQCNENYIWEYDDSQGILYDSCILYNHDKNCLAAKQTNSTNSCMVCKKGYYLNKDDYCEQIQITQCKGFNDGIEFNKLNYSIINYSHFQLKGCVQCEQEFEMFREIIDFPVCITTEYFNHEEFYKSYIKNCKLYETNLDSIKCYQCSNGYTVNMQGTECINIELLNCQRLRDSQKCGKCNQGYVLINGQCIKQNLLHCAVYDTEIDSEIQICSKCDDGYYWNNTQCILGSVLKCKTYVTNQHNCVECLYGYTLGTDKDGTKFCLKNDPEMRCLKYSSITQGVSNCLQCDHDYILTEQMNSFRVVSCLEIPAMSHCLYYTMEQNISHSSLQCLQCIQHYYLNDHHVCVERDDSIQGCLEYEDKGYKCKICQEGNFVNEDGQCEINPTGIQHCYKYLNELQCEQCEAPYYLDIQYNCIKVAQPIDKCFHYDHQQLCTQCEDGYYINQVQQCEPITIHNCLVSYDDVLCVKCKHGYVSTRKPSHGKEDQCQKIIPTAFCSQYHTEVVYQCKKCISGYYLDKEYKCQEVKNYIKNCEMYIDKDTCQRCGNDTVLSRDNKECLEDEKYKIKMQILLTRLLSFKWNLYVMSIRQLWIL